MVTKEEKAARDRAEKFYPNLPRKIEFQLCKSDFLDGIKWRDETLKQLLTMINNGHNHADLRLHIERALNA